MFKAEILTEDECLCGTPIGLGGYNWAYDWDVPVPVCRACYWELPKCDACGRVVLEVHGTEDGSQVCLMCL